MMINVFSHFVPYVVVGGVGGVGARHALPLQRRASLSPELEGIDDVLPQDVSGGGDGGQGVQVCLGHPDGEDGIFLSEALSRRYGVAVVFAYASACEELQAAQDEGYGQQSCLRLVCRAVVANHEVHGCSRHDGERRCPQVKSQPGDAEQCLVYFGRPVSQRDCGKQGEDEQGEYLPADKPCGLDERQRFVRSRKREVYRDGDGDGDVAEKYVSGEEADITAEHTRDDGCGRCRGREYAQHRTLCNDAVEGEQQAVQPDACGQLDEQQPQMGRMEAYVFERDFAERQEQHDEEQVGGQKRKAADPGVGQRAGYHCDREYPVFYKLQHSGVYWMGMYRTNASIAS